MKGIALALASFAKSLSFVIPTIVKIEESKKRKKRDVIKHFRLELTHKFWGIEKKFIQRDQPLTDAELSELGY